MAAERSSPSQEANAQGCGRCKTMEEDFYWKHIKTLRFWVLLSGNFHQKLHLPKKLADNMKLTAVQPKMTLRGPSGASWDVLLMTGADGLFLQDGWEEFVKSYSLEENNVLFFKYDRHLSFDVKIFDGECEKEEAYFVRKCDHVVQKRASSEISQENDDDGVCNIPKKARVDVVSEPTGPQLCKLRRRTPKQTPTRQKPVQPAPRKKATSRSLKDLQGLDSHANPGPEKQPDQNGPANKDVPSVNQNPPGVSRTCPPGAPQEKEVLLEARGRPRRPCYGRKTVSVDQNPLLVTKSCPPGATYEKVVLHKMGGKTKKLACSNKQTASADQCPLEPGEGSSSDAASKKAALCSRRGRPRKPSCSQKKKASTGERYVSNRRPVTELEKDQALRIACEILTDISFFVTMRPSCCYKSFFMKIPPKWASAYLGPKNYSVTLRVGEKTWATRYNFRECALDSGWKLFALENHLEEFDVCLFELVCKDRDSVMLDVTIVRVVEEVTPPTFLTA